MKKELCAPGKTTIIPEVLVNIARLTPLSADGVSHTHVVPKNLSTS